MDEKQLLRELKKFKVTHQQKSDGTHDMNFPATVVKGIAHGFTVDRQTVVDCTKLSIPLLQCPVQFNWCYANQDVTNGALTGDAIFSPAETTAKAVASSGR